LFRDNGLAGATFAADPSRVTDVLGARGRTTIFWWIAHSDLTPREPALLAPVSICPPADNHLFQRAETGSPREFAKIEETLAPEVLSLTSHWIVEHTR
jgi:hypothetical protein